MNNSHGWSEVPLASSLIWLRLMIPISLSIAHILNPTFLLIDNPLVYEIEMIDLLAEKMRFHVKQRK